MPKFHVLIPAYNAELTLPELLKQLSELTPAPEKIYIVNDCSTDNTVKIAKEFGVEILENIKNTGKGFSLRKGFQRFLEQNNCDYLLCIDADLQHPVNAIPDFLSVVKNGKPEIVIGNRRKSVLKMPILRVISNTLTSLILSILTKQKINDSQCGFRLIHRQVLKDITLEENGFQLESEFIIKASKLGFSISFVSIPTLYNTERSNIRHMGDTYRFIRLILKEMFSWSTQQKENR